MPHSSSVAKRVGAVRATLHKARPKSERAWLAEIDAAADPQAELAGWEIVAFAYSAFFEARTPTAKARDQALRVLLDCAAGASEAEIHKAAYKSLRIAEIKSLIAHYKAAACAARAIAQLKKNASPGG